MVPHILLKRETYVHKRYLIRQAKKTTFYLIKQLILYCVKTKINQREPKINFKILTAD